MIQVTADPVFERVQLDEHSWVDVARGWLEGADELFDALLNGVAWQPSKVFRYEKYVDERRLGSFWSRGRPLPHPALAPIHKAIQRDYNATFNGFGMIQYRNAGDGQAFHRDTDMRWLDDTIIAVLTLGAKRPWLLRPRTARLTTGALKTGKGATQIRRRAQAHISEDLGENAPILETVIGHLESPAVDVRERGQLAHELERDAAAAPQWYEQLRAGQPVNTGPARTSGNLAQDFRDLTQELFRRLVEAEQQQAALA